MALMVPLLVWGIQHLLRLSEEDRRQFVGARVAESA
jgi:hypothetical protein